MYYSSRAVRTVLPSRQTRPTNRVKTPVANTINNRGTIQLYLDKLVQFNLMAFPSNTVRETAEDLSLREISGLESGTGISEINLRLGIFLHEN